MVHITVFVCLEKLYISVVVSLFCEPVASERSSSFDLEGLGIKDLHFRESIVNCLGGVSDDICKQKRVRKCSYI